MVTGLAHATELDTIGDTRLRTNQPSLLGNGITMAQPEAVDSTNSPAFEINPGAVAQPESLFTWISTNGSATVFPNNLGAESFHADLVAVNFLSVAPAAGHIDNYEADYFYDEIITPGIAISDQIVNQSFAFGSDPPQQVADSAYDDYIVANKNIFCSAAGLSTTPSPPGTAYNCIAITDYGGAPGPQGPTLDNGRSKPDLVAPGPEESFAIPYVSGSTAILLQAAPNSSAADLRTIKALLLNGALKPNDWTNSTTAPLDRRYGAGVVNVFYSETQLATGQQPFTTSTTEFNGNAHPPISHGAPIASLSGWDYQSIATSFDKDTVNHYYFDASNSSTGFTLNATLVWDRGTGQTRINNLGLFLYNAVSGALVASSVSTVDNVQHIYVPHLASGTYDLQAIKFGGASQSVTSSEIYALAFQFFPITPPPLSITESAAATIVSWTSSPTIFILQQTSSLTPPVVWSAIANPGLITNTFVAVTLPNPPAATYYRLIR